MNKKLICTLSAVALIAVAGVSFTIGKTTQKPLDTTQQSNNKDNTNEVLPNNEETSKIQLKYEAIDNEEKGTIEIKIDNKVIIKDLRLHLGETDRYLVYSKIGKNNIPDSEILDWDIALINKYTGDVTILEDALYVQDNYIEYTELFYITDNTFYGVKEDSYKLFKIDLSKDTIKEEMIENSPTIENVAGYYNKENLLFIVDPAGDILSYNDKTKEFTKHTYTVQSTVDILNFSEINSPDIFTKVFRFVENHENQDGLELYINRDEESEQYEFFTYDKNNNNFTIEE